MINISWVFMASLTGIKLKNSNSEYFETEERYVSGKILDKDRVV